MCLNFLVDKSPHLESSSVVSDYWLKAAAFDLLVSCYLKKIDVALPNIFTVAEMTSPYSTILPLSVVVSSVMSMLMYKSYFFSIADTTCSNFC